MKHGIFTKTFVMAGAVSVMLSLPAYALSLDQARASGAVGEKMDGYAVALKSSPEVNRLVAEINAKRRAQYQRISQENGQPIDVVAKLASVQIIGNLSKGMTYQTPDGAWKKR